MKNFSHFWINPNLKARKDIKYGKNGKGVFATENIPKNEVLAVFGGNIYDLRNKKEHEEVKNAGDYTLQINDRFVIGVTNKEQFSASEYFNHSCNPNSGIRGQIFLVSMRKILSGEEIVFDYSMAIHHMPGVPFYSMICSCGSKNCRGKVTEDDWKIPSLQKKYAGYFNIFIQDKINSMRK